MSDQQRVARAFLTTVAKPGDAVLRQLIAKHGPAGTAELVATVGDSRRDWELAALQQLDAARRHGIRFLAPGDDEWPATLAHSGGPVGLWVRGAASLGLLLRRAVVVLGATAATPYATDAARRIAAELAAAGWTVVTSGDFGVAGAVRRAALSVERPAVVLPLGGLTRPGPVGHARLFTRTAYRGVLVSESPQRPPSREADLVRQSRLLACLGAAVVLVEPHPGGSAGAVTRTARQLRRPLLAVPGPVTSDRSAFAHQLLRDGAARLVRDAGDVLADLTAHSDGGR